MSSARLLLRDLEAGEDNSIADYLLAAPRMPHTCASDTLRLLCCLRCVQKKRGAGCTNIKKECIVTDVMSADV